MSSINALITGEMKRVPLIYLERLLERKVRDAGHEPPQDFIKAVAQHIMTNPGDRFDWDDGSEASANIELEITATDIDELVADVTDFMDNELVVILEKLSVGSSKSVLQSLDRDWPVQKAHDAQRMEEFRNNLKDRWGDAFDILRMMYTIAIEVGNETAKRWRRSRAPKKNALRNALQQLHARACQVTAEIICLMENGFADGAMARWRTLHEIAVVAAIIAEHGNDLAERYWAHEAIESKRAMDKYVAAHKALGYAPLSQRAMRKIEREYELALEIFGYNFGQQYGWAIKHLGLKKPRFDDLEAAAGEIAKRPFYNMASYNVHATTKGLSLRLGVLKGGSVIALAGASNAGFVEPAQNTAVELVRTTILLYGPSWRFDHIVEMRVLIALRDRLPNALSRADRELDRDHLRQVSKPKVRPFGRNPKPKVD